MKVLLITALWIASCSAEYGTAGGFHGGNIIFGNANHNSNKYPVPVKEVRKIPLKRPEYHKTPLHPKPPILPKYYPKPSSYHKPQPHPLPPVYSKRPVQVTKVVHKLPLKPTGYRKPLVPAKPPTYPKRPSKPMTPRYPKKVIKRPMYKEPPTYPKKPAYKKGMAVSRKPASGGHGYFPSKDSKYRPKIVPNYKRVANVAPLTAFGGCPHGWLPYGGHCYYFSRDKMRWFAASMKCRYMGGYLAVVDSAHENSYLKLMAGKYRLKPGVWFGLNDILFPQTHKWFWGNGQQQCKWFDWYGKGPTFSKGGYRHCVAMWCDKKWQWHVQNCHSKQYYVCELNPGKPCKCGY